MDRRAFTALAAGSAAFLPFVSRPAASSATTASAGLLDARDYGAVGDGMTNDLPALLAALAAAAGSRAVGVWACAGVYRLANTTAGRIFDLVRAGLMIVGDGIGQTVFRLDDNVTLTAHMRLFRLAGTNQAVRDCSIVWGSGWSGGFDTSGLDIDTGGVYWRAERVECVGVYGYGSAGGTGIGCYQDPSANSGQQFGVAEECITRDSPLACGFGTNSNNNAFTRCIALRCGNSLNRHGFYSQGGATRYEQCYAEACGGFSYHAHKQNQSLDASGDVYDGCVSVSPGWKHMIADSFTPPSGQPLTRYVTIVNCTFRGASEGMEVKVPAIITGNTFDGVRKVGSYALAVSAGAASSIVKGNLLLNSGNIQATDAATIVDNTLSGGGLVLNAAGTVARGNRIAWQGVSGAGATGIVINAATVTVEQNYLMIGAPGTCIKVAQPVGAVIRNNILNATGGAWYFDMPQTGAALLDGNILR
jgi:hypothetical protein